MINFDEFRHILCDNFETFSETGSIDLKEQRGRPINHSNPIQNEIQTSKTNIQQTPSTSI